MTLNELNTELLRDIILLKIMLAEKPHCFVKKREFLMTVNARRMSSLKNKSNHGLKK